MYAEEPIVGLSIYKEDAEHLTNGTLADALTAKGLLLLE